MPGPVAPLSRTIQRQNPLYKLCHACMELASAQAPHSTSPAEWPGVGPGCLAHSTADETFHLGPRTPRLTSSSLLVYCPVLSFIHSQMPSPWIPRGSDLSDVKREVLSPVGVEYSLGSLDQYIRQLLSTKES